MHNCIFTTRRMISCCIIVTTLVDWKSISICSNKVTCLIIVTWPTNNYSCFNLLTLSRYNLLITAIGQLNLSLDSYFILKLICWIFTCQKLISCVVIICLLLPSLVFKNQSRLMLWCCLRWLSIIVIRSMFIVILTVLTSCSPASHLQTTLIILLNKKLTRRRTSFLH